MRKLTHREIQTRQIKKTTEPRIPACVLLNNIRSLYNVGSIFRTADGVGLEKVWLCGITGYPPNAEISKVALSADQRVAWDYRKDPVALAKELKKSGYQIVLLEQTEKSISHDEFVPKFPVCLIVGHEVMGVADELVHLSDAAIEIEMAGVKNSLNVAVAFGVVAYRWRGCFKHNSLSVETPGRTSLRQIR